MKLARRRFLGLAATALAAPAVRRASAETYPTRPVHVIVGQAAGSSSDIHARLIGRWLSEHLGQQFIVDVRPGAGGNIGTEAVVRASADGYTLLLVNAQNAINVSLYDNPGFNFIKDIAPIGGIDRTPLILEVNPSVPARTVPEFIAYAKANPGKVNMASAGTGGPQHVAGELFKMMAGVDMVHVPYRGSTPGLADLMGGRVQVMFDVVGSSIEHVRSGKLRALAVTSMARLDVLPDIPTVNEFLPGYEAYGWIGLGAPRNVPAEIIDQLNRETNAALANSEIKGRLTDLGGTLLPGSPADFGQFIVAETEKWAKVVKSANIKAD